MASYKNWTGSLGELCDALGIARTGPIDCFARNDASQPPCRMIPQSKRPKIGAILREILDNASNEETVQGLVLQLAEPLRCYKAHHKDPIQVDGRSYEVFDYIASRLNVALRTWHQDRIRSSKNRDGLQFQQNQDIDIDSDDDVIEETIMESASASCQRPKLVREKPMERDPFNTPTKKRGSSNRMPRTPTTRDKPASTFSARSFIDDLLIESPDSVFSPDPSEVFTPAPVASTPMSAGAYTGSSFGESHYFRKTRMEESPTRRLATSMKRLGIHTSDPDARDNWESDDEDERHWLSDEDAWETDESDINDFIDDDEHVEHYPDEYDSDTSEKFKTEPETESEAESDVPSPTIPHRPEQPEQRTEPRMEFKPMCKIKNPILDIHDKIATPINPKSAVAGYVYCYALPSEPGYLKIGHVRLPDIGSNQQMANIDPSKDEYKIKNRIAEWERGCKHNIDYKWSIFMPCAAQKMESLIHATLHDERRKILCPNCKKKHIEWFEVTESKARRTVEVWQQFSRLNPYDELGALSRHWYRYAINNRYNNTGCTTEAWLEGAWIDAMSEAAAKHSREAQKVQEIQEERIQLQEKKQAIEKALKKHVRRAWRKLWEIEEKTEALRWQERALRINSVG